MFKMHFGKEDSASYVRVYNRNGLTYLRVVNRDATEGGWLKFRLNRDRVLQLKKIQRETTGNMETRKARVQFLAFKWKERPQ